MKTTSQARIFISYSHRGKGPQWKAALLRALRVFEQHHLLDVWQDGKIRVSSFWDDDIKQAMGNARLAVVLLTRESLESEYILDTEFPLLRERQQNKDDKLPVFPVICEECNWRAHDWLRATQAPNESNPLSRLSAAAQDGVFRVLATEIANELSRVALAELPKADQPLAPEHIYLDRFPLTQSAGPREEKLIGREQELALLDLAFAQPHTNIVSLVAWGGVGKTMLVQHWLQRLQREGWFGARRVYAWSFYSQGTKEDRQTSEDSFLAHALEWFGVQCEPTLSPWDKGRLLADAVARQRTLLILDGIEPLQYPPGPMGGQLRAPGVQCLLKQLARRVDDAEHRGLCLVTTREPLTDLAHLQRRPDAAWGSVLRVDLGNLTADAGAALLHHAGAKRAGAADIKDDDNELLAASREVDGHALTLNLLGRFLARAHDGDIRRRGLVKFEEADLELQGGTTFKMLAAFENWFDRSGGLYQQSLAILRMLGLFDRPADVNCLGALWKPPVLAGLTDPLFHSRGGLFGWARSYEPLSPEDWNTATSFLADFGLIAIQPGADDRGQLLDCHPLIREYFSSCLRDRSPKLWRSANIRLYNHLCSTVPDRSEPSLTELEVLYQAVAHGCSAGLQNKACDDVYSKRILQFDRHYSLRQFGAFGTDLAALASFYERPWSRLASGLTRECQSFLLHETATRLQALGRLTEALDPLTLSIKLDVNAGEYYAAAISCCTLGDVHLALGNLADSTAAAKWAVNYADLCGADPTIHSYRNSNAFLQCSASRPRLANALHQSGYRDMAEDLFRKSEQWQATEQPEYPLLYGDVGCMYCDFMLAPAECLAWRRVLEAIQFRTRDGVHMQTTTPSLATDAAPWANDDVTLHIQTCRNVARRVEQVCEWREADDGLFNIALEHLTQVRAALFEALLSARSPAPLHSEMEPVMDELRRAGMHGILSQGILTRSVIRFYDGVDAGPKNAQSDLDEAWDIAATGPMRLCMADILLYRARLFFNRNHYPWKSPQDDLANAQTIINDCSYHRRQRELADAKRVILGA